MGFLEARMVPNDDVDKDTGQVENPLYGSIYRLYWSKTWFEGLIWRFAETQTTSEIEIALATAEFFRTMGLLGPVLSCELWL
jgi:hypothetical protein